MVALNQVNRSSRKRQSSFHQQCSIHPHAYKKCLPVVHYPIILTSLRSQTSFGHDSQLSLRISQAQLIQQLDSSTRR